MSKGVAATPALPWRQGRHGGLGLHVQGGSRNACVYLATGQTRGSARLYDSRALTADRRSVCDLRSADLIGHGVRDYGQPVLMIFGRGSVPATAGSVRMCIPIVLVPDRSDIARVGLEQQPGH